MKRCIKNVMFLTIAICLLLRATDGRAQDSTFGKVSTVIAYSSDKHCAFTDLTYYKGYFYLVFREAPVHVVSPEALKNSYLVIMKSKNGNSWKVQQKIHNEGTDFRDPKFLIIPTGNKPGLFITTFGMRSYKSPSSIDADNYYISLDASGKWSSPIKFDLPDVKGNRLWLWRPTYYNGKYYGLAYQFYTDSKSKIFLLSGSNLNNMNIERDYDLPGIPTEGTIKFNGKGNPFVIIRRETGPSLIGAGDSDTSAWKELPVKGIGGPNILPEGQDTLLVAGRIDGQTKVWLYDLDKNRKLKSITLTDAQETGYPGIVQRANRYYISYYAINNGRSEIRVANFKNK